MELRLSEVLSAIAIVISLASASFSFLQMKTARNQAILTDLQIRPYLKYLPIFAIEKGSHLTINMHGEDVSPVPGRVIYDQLSTWVNGETTGAFLYNKMGDILYEHKGSGSVLPDMPQKMQKDVVSGAAELLIGTCMIYSSVSAPDTRRWEIKALYAFAPGSEIADERYVREEEIDQSVDRCDSATLRDEWLQTHHPK